MMTGNFRFLRCDPLNKLVLVCLGMLLAIPAWAVTIQWQGLEDPRIKEPLFDSYQGRHFEAIIRLQTEQKLRRTKKQQSLANLVMGNMYLSYGFHQEAANIFEAMLGPDQPVEVRDQAWFYLAKAQYQSGRAEQAVSTLSRIEKPLPYEMQAERQVMEALVDLQSERYAKAIEVLKGLDSKTRWWLYGRYNLAVALYKNGQQAEALSILETLAEIRVDDDETRNLRDKANLVMAYDLLNKEKPTEAEAAFKRIRLQGPHANAALLGLGRAYAAQGRHKDSLVPWLTLVERSPADPAVQDALMALPSAFGELHAFKQALQYYDKALKIFQGEIARINTAAESVAGGKLSEGLIRARTGEQAAGVWTVKNVLDTPEGNYLWPVVAGYEYQKTLFNYSQLRLSLGKLESWSSDVNSFRGLEQRRRGSYENRITQLQQQILLASEKLDHHLKSLAYDELDRRKQRLVNYYNEARFSVAQVYDYAAKRWGAGSE